MSEDGKIQSKLEKGRTDERKTWSPYYSYYLKILSARNWLLIASVSLVVCVAALLFIRRYEAEFNSKHSSYMLSGIVARKALGHSARNNPYGIAGRTHGHGRCNFWQGEWCSGIVAKHALLESSRDLALVVNAFEEPCKYLILPAQEKRINISGEDEKAVVEEVRAISTARNYADCERKGVEDGEPNHSRKSFERFFIYFYEGDLGDYRAEKVRIVLEVKPKTDANGDEK